MESSSIVLKVMSGRDLKAFNFFQKLSVYAIASIASEDPNRLEKSQQQRTPTDREGDGQPEWNHEMRFDLQEASLKEYDHLLIHFVLHAEVVFGDKVIGEVRVPFKDLMDELKGIVRFVSYEVRGPDGKPNGVLNFSYKVNAKDKEIGAASLLSNIDGYSVVHQPSHEALYPKVEVESCYSPSQVHPPSLEFSNPSQETCSRPEGNHYHSPEVHHTSHEVHHPSPYDIYYPPPPPPHDMNYPPGPPPPPPHLQHHPLPPPMAHGEFYHPRPPPPNYPWAFASSYD